MDTDMGTPGNEPGTDDEDRPWVQLDRIGTPRQPSREHTALLVSVGLIEASVRRLQETGAFELSDDVDRAGDADVLLVSTRLGRTELRRALAMLSDIPRPLVVLAHTGGESLAVDVMRHGGTAVLAEGNETGLVALLDGTGHDAGLLDTYARHFGHSASHSGSGSGRDGVTGLPDGGRLEERVDELVATGDLPRVGFVQLPRLANGSAGFSPTALTLLRRRLAAQFRQAATELGCELFAVSPAEFGIVSVTLTPNQAERLGIAFQRVASAYSTPDNHPLEVALGHAGSEVASDPAMLRELAQRALQVAVVDPARRVLGADALSIGASAATELETGTRIVAFVERHSRFGEGHGGRVAGHAAELAHLLGLEGGTRVATELAARLHDVGKVGLPTEAMSGPAGLDGELLEAYRSHPVRGWSYLRASAGDTVSRAVRAQHERWDGTGFPDGLAGEAIPLEGRVLAAAHVVEELLLVGGSSEDVEALSGTRLDPELAPLAAGLLARYLEQSHGAA